jgi:hypothetical protein
MGGKPEETTPITFSSNEFRNALVRAETDLKEFLGPLRAWLDINAPQHASEIVDLFKSIFVERNS